MKKFYLLNRTIAVVGMVFFAVMTASATDIHVATTGNDDNTGTEEAPLLTIHRAMELVQAGDRILIHEGTYTISERIKIPALPTNPDKRCEMRAWPEEAVGKVIIDGSAMNHKTESAFKMGRCIYVNHLANYWTFYGLTLQNAEDNGMKVEGSYNTIERCVFRWNNDTGLQIGMYKDFSIEETKSLPISGQPEYNPGYSYCRYNKVINCDSYENFDSRSYNGTDDGGDADGFACKLFPGPGTEFHGCRAWTNSDDNWDLYMVYHPVVIDHCWAWHAGYTKDGREGKNGNGFKLGGGGSAGGAAFDQSVGAHVVTNCVAFDNLHKGFDQNNAYEGMYVFNCVAWGNEYNYRFPTVFKYGVMTIRNCVGWGATAQKNNVSVGNHEFLSPDKEGYQDPDTDFNSWTTIDGCNPIKEGYKDGNTQIVTQDHSGEFLSLSVADFQAERGVDGSLPDNNFAKLKPGSIFKDMGTPIIGYTPVRKMTEEQCAAARLEYITADDVYIPYNDAAPDFGAYELDGVPADFTIPEKILLTCSTANSSQEVISGQAIEPIVYEWNEVGLTAVVEDLAEGLIVTYNTPDAQTTNALNDQTTNAQSLTISGKPTSGCTFKVTVSGNAAEGVKPVSTTGTVTLVRPFRILTGDWYHFQDAQDNLPADLKDALELIQGDNSEASKALSSIDPEKEESGSGFGKGALCMGQSNGGMKLKLSSGILEWKLNLYFTGGRTFKITYTLADGTTTSTKTKKYSKGSYGSYDVLDAAGLTDEDVMVNVRSITFQQDGANGGARVYDMYVRVPEDAGTTTGIEGVGSRIDGQGETLEGRRSKVFRNGRLIILKNGLQYNVQGQELQ